MLIQFAKSLLGHLHLHLLTRVSPSRRDLGPGGRRETILGWGHTREAQVEARALQRCGKSPASRRDSVCVQAAASRGDPRQRQGGNSAQTREPSSLQHPDNTLFYYSPLVLEGTYKPFHMWWPNATADHPKRGHEYTPLTITELLRALLVGVYRTSQARNGAAGIDSCSRRPIRSKSAKNWALRGGDTGGLWL